MRINNMQANITLIYDRIAEIPVSYRKFESRNTMLNIMIVNFLLARASVNSSLVCCKQANSCDIGANHREEGGGHVPQNLYWSGNDVRPAQNSAHFTVYLTTRYAVYYGRPMEQGRPLYFHAVVSIFYLSIYLFSSPNFSGRRLDVYHASTHGVALVRIQNAGLKRAARCSLKIQDAKKSPKIATWAPSHNFVGLYLRN